MKKSLLAGIFLLTTLLPASAQNLLQDGGFENTKTYDYANNKSTGELPRISALGRLGNNTETSNPVMEAETVVQGSWYRKSANSGYNHGKIVSDDYAEGEKALNLSISAGSTTTKLDTWDNNTAIQYVTIDRTKQYVLKFKAKNLVGNYPVFAGMSVGGGYEVSGSNWVILSSNWEEYTVTIDPTQHQSSDTHYSDGDFQKSGVVFGNRTEYDENNKSLESSILIDDVRLYEKGTEPEEGNVKDFIINGNFETGEPNTSIVTGTDKWGDFVGKWALVIKDKSTGTGSITTEEVHNGSQALKVELTNISARYHFFLTQELQNLTPGEYTFALWMKASKADIPFRVDFSIDDDNIDVVKSAQTTAAEWTRYEIKVDLSDKTSEDLSTLRIRIRPNCTSSGSVKNEAVTYYIDDISFTSASSEEEKPDEGEQKEFITNGDFEIGDPNSSIVMGTDPWGSNLVNTWGLVIKGSSTGTGTITTEEIHGGSQALKIDLTNIDARYRFFLAQEVQNLASAEYTFVMWMKASKAGIPFRVDFSINNNTKDILTSSQTTATEWTRYEIKVDMSDIKTTDLSTCRISIRPNCASGGSVQNEAVTYYLDDISFKGVVPDVIIFQPEPYLQSKTTESILINWRSADGEEGVPTVEYGTTDLNLTATGTTKSVGSLKWSGVRLTGLSPDTEYQYRCRIGDNISEVYKFRTLPDKNVSRKIRFLSFGDSHEASSVTPVREAALKFLKQEFGEDLQNHFDFITCTGDIIYNYGQYENEFVESLFTPNKELTNALPMNIAAGNHDFEKNDSEHSYFYDFMDFTDLSDAEGDAKGKYYAQQIGNALYIYLNTNRQYLCPTDNSNQTYQTNTEAQLKWLKDKLTTAESDNTIDMVFIFGHHGHRYEMWSAPDNTATREEIAERLFPVFENSTKIKMYMYGHTHSVERGILELKNGKSITLFLNGNGGSYPDYFGKYSTNIDYPEIHRNSEFIGFAITEVDPVEKSYQTTYYGVSQRRPVNGASSTTYIRKYDPAEIIDQWSAKCDASVPTTPTMIKQEYNATDGIFSLEASPATDMMSAEYQIINTANQEMVIDTIIHRENIFGVTGYFETDGKIDLEKSYLPVDLNEGIDLSTFTAKLPTGNYKAKIRYRDNNLNWSDYSDINSSIDSPVETDNDVVIAGGTAEVVIVSDGGIAEIYSPYGALLAKTILTNGENRINVTPDSQVIVRVVRNNKCTVKNLRVK